MKTLYIECAMGAAGDMLTAALLEQLPDRAAFLEKMNGLGIPGVTVSAEKGVKCGVSGTHFSVRVAGVEEDENLHSHHHDHVHGSMEGIEEIVNRLPIPSMVKLDILAVYNLIAEAESRVHGVPVQQIHFHEVGTMDAVADITAVCLLMREIRPDQVIVSPISVGSGTVRCAHGILPVPAPATALLLEGMPIQAGTVQSELCTPTGAALLKYFADDFGNLPVMRVQKTGYGMGKKDFPQANCLRVMLGQTADQTDAIAELCCNIDDMTGEELGFDMEQLLGGGALDVLFCAAGGALFFLLAMRSESGRMGTWSLAASAVGFCMYMHTLSAVLLPVFTAVDAAAVRAAQGCKKVIKKFCKYAKSIFQKSRECFIIKYKRKVD